MTYKFLAIFVVSLACIAIVGFSLGMILGEFSEAFRVIGRVLSAVKGV